MRVTDAVLIVFVASYLPLGCTCLLPPLLVPLARQRIILGSPLSKGVESSVCHFSPGAKRRLSFQSEKVDTESVSASLTEKTDLLLPGDITSIDDLVRRHADARGVGEYDLADDLRDEIDNLAKSCFPPGHRLELKDIPRKLGGGSTWEISPKLKVPIERYPDDEDDGASVLQLSHAAIGLATSAAERDVPVNQKELDDIVSKALDRLEWTGATELRGRKAADAAFWFALAGVSAAGSSKAESLFDSLTLIAIEELRRFGMRASCRAKDIMHIVERLAAAGITGKLSGPLHKVAADCLEDKGFKGCNTSTSSDVLGMLRKGEFDMHSDRSLLWIWRFSIRQRKQRSFLRVAAKQYERTAPLVNDSEKDVPLESEKDAQQVEHYLWGKMFDDPTVPLIVDVGSGMGVSLHGLATLEGKSSANIDMEWNKFNYLGVDLSRLAVGYANGIASRWGINGRLSFCVGSAENVLEQIQNTYPGGVKLIMIQFPTPFRLQSQRQVDDVTHMNNVGYDDEKPADALPATNKGNTQLPKHPFNGFMVTKELLCCAYETLQRSNGKLLIQSNCEDVAVMMRKLAEEEAGFKSVQVPNFVTSFGDSKVRLPKRTAEYIKLGGERALGEGWSAEALLPRRGATETEIACFLERTPVHRSVFLTSRGKE